MLMDDAQTPDESESSKFLGVDFGTLDWRTVPSTPSAEVKVAHLGTKRIRLIRFQARFRETGWCKHGHVVYVLSGEFQTYRQPDTLQHWKQGSAFVIPEGAAHRSANLGAGAAVVLIIDDVEDDPETLAYNEAIAWATF